MLIVPGLLAGCGKQEAPDDGISPVHGPEIARLAPADKAIAGAHIPTLDPMPLVDAEIRKVLGPAPHCEFRYATEGKPVLATRAAPNSDAPGGLVKVNGHLVALRRLSLEAGALELNAGSIRVTVTPEGGELAGGARRREADVLFEVGDSLRVGFRGYYECVD